MQREMSIDIPWGIKGKTSSAVRKKSVKKEKTFTVTSRLALPHYPNKRLLVVIYTCLVTPKVAFLSVCLFLFPSADGTTGEISERPRDEPHL